METEQRVFIPQVPTRYDSASGRRIPAVDLSAAAMFGGLETVLDAEDNPLLIRQLTPKIRKRLEEFRQHDYFVALGDPSVIALCAGILFRRFDKIQMLKWDNIQKHYMQIDLRA
jgi:hypothetical protein